MVLDSLIPYHLNRQLFRIGIYIQSASEEIKRLKEIRESLSEAVISDSLFRTVNEALKSQNFTDQILTVIPDNAESGQFTIEYRSKTSEIITVSGTIKDTEVISITEEST